MTLRTIGTILKKTLASAVAEFRAQCAWAASGLSSEEWCRAGVKDLKLAKMLSEAGISPGAHLTDPLTEREGVVFCEIFFGTSANSPVDILLERPEAFEAATWLVHARLRGHKF